MNWSIVDVSQTTTEPNWCGSICWSIFARKQFQRRQRTICIRGVQPASACHCSNASKCAPIFPWAFLTDWLMLDRLAADAGNNLHSKCKRHPLFVSSRVLTTSITSEKHLQNSVINWPIHRRAKIKLNIFVLLIARNAEIIPLWLDPSWQNQLQMWCDCNAFLPIEKLHHSTFNHSDIYLNCFCLSIFW